MMRHTLSLVMLFFALAISANASATMFKCKTQDGSISFQQNPCSSEQITEWSKVTEQEKKQQRLEEERLLSAQRASDQFMAEQEAERAWQDTDIPEHIKTSILSYLDLALKDPDSLKDLTWLAARTNGDGYRVRLSYRAKNGYGAYGGLSDQTYRTNLDGKVLWNKDSDKVNWYRIK